MIPAILYEGLDHPWILYPQGVLEPTPSGYQGPSGESKVIREFLTAWEGGVGALTLHCSGVN